VWIVRLALRRPYSVAVFCLVVLMMGVLSATRMVTDVLPNIDIPVVVVVWNYNGLTAEDMERRIIYISERAYSSSVAGIEHIDSESIPGIGILRVYFEQGADIGAAIAQISSVSLTASRSMPPGITPPVILQFNASNVPVAQLTMSSDTVTEQEMYDYGLNFLRLRLFTIPGLSTPAPYGGATRQVSIDLDPQKLLATGISAADVVSTMLQQNVILPAGLARLGDRQYDVRLNGSPTQAVDFNDIPIKVVNGAPIHIGDVAHVHDGFATQENVVRVNGKRAAYLSILRKANASTIAVVDSTRDMLPTIKAAAPAGLELKVEFDQSVFVRSAIKSVLREALISAGLVSLMVLAFIGSWRSMLIVATSIPVAILVGVTGLFVSQQSLNVMTLGGLALAIGMLVDDATVEIENINRNRQMGKKITVAILDGARQVAVPALAATLTICIVFFPVVMLTGPAKFLFIPLALAVVFSMLASYLLSRTLVPTMARLLLEKEPIEAGKTGEGGEGDHHDSGKDAQPEEGGKKGLWARANRWRDEHFDALKNAYARVLASLMERRGSVLILMGLLVVCAGTLPLIVGLDFFPSVDAGQMRIHFRAPIGTRIEETERIVGQFEDSIRRIVPESDLDSIDDTIGVPTSYNLAFIQSDNVGEADADVFVSLKPGHKPTDGYVRRIRREAPGVVPGSTFYFQPANIIERVLNFGLSAPIDVQIEGRDEKGNLAIARQVREKMQRIAGAADVRIPQVFNQPTLDVRFDRERGARIGVTEQNAAMNLVTVLSSSTFVAPSFWVNPDNAVNYFVSVQQPVQQIHSLGDLMGTSIGLPTQSPGASGAPAAPEQPTPTSVMGLPVSTTTAIPEAAYLGLVATVSPGQERALINHYSVQPIVDVQCSVEDRDLGGVSSDVESAVDSVKDHLPKGSRITVRGQSQSMRSSFESLGAGMLLAIALVYLLMVVLFQSWLDPLIIMVAVPGSLIGVLWMLVVTGTTLNVESLMGAIMAIGIAVSNSILLVNFANDVRVEKRLGPVDAAIEAGRTRLRPVLMTALAMILGMLPMALALGEGGEQNAPLGRAVIGGLLVATFITLFVVPVVYSMLRTKAPQKHEMDERFAAESEGAEA
jgi:multidrug efflux pump subunit AcrB